MAVEISVETVCQFISAHGGKIKNTALVAHFKKALNNPDTRDAARQKFKECVNTVAVVKTENGDKYVQLKKKYRPPSMSSSISSVNSENAAETSSNSSSMDRPPITSFPSYTELPSEHSTSFASQSKLPYADAAQSSDRRSSDSDHQATTDFPVLEAPSVPPPPPVETYDNVIPQSAAPEESPSEPVPSQHPPKQEEPVENTAKQQDVVEDGPPKKLTPITAPIEDKVRKSVPAQSAQQRSTGKPESGEFAVPAAPKRVKTKERKENVPPSPGVEHRLSSSIDRAKAGLQAMSADQGRISRNRPSLMQTSYAGSVERARLNFQNKQRQNDDTTSLAMSERSVDSKGETEDDQERANAPICWDPNEKLFLLKSAQGNMVEMRKLLDLDPTLAEKRDFFMGYTALHWAAKKGNVDMVNMLLDQKADINAKSNGGYTPLHLAAMRGHEHVITHLLEYDADPTIRDHSGRQAIHYIKSMSLPLQRLLFGNDGSQRSKDFAAGLRPRLDSVRRSTERLSVAISGGFGPVGALVTKSTEDLSRAPEGSPAATRRMSASKEGKKMSKKKSRKKKDERPSISIVSFDDFDSGYAGSLSGKSTSLTSISLSASSPNLSRNSAPATPNSSQSRQETRTRSHTDYQEASSHL